MSRRRRVFRSSSQGELGLLNQVRPIESPAALWDKKYSIPEPAASNPAPKSGKKFKTAVSKQENQAILAIESPPREERDAISEKKADDEGIAAFLEHCFLCKKRIAVKEDIHMYGYLHAFCSPECRNNQMALDGFEKEIAKEEADLKKTKHTTR